MTYTNHGIYTRNDEKNQYLKQTRGIDFEDAIECIAQGGLLAIEKHHNPEKYPHQQKLIIRYKDYIYYIPCTVENGTYILKTIIPSRQLTKRFL